MANLANILKEAKKELKGYTLTAVEMDNILMGLGFGTEFNTDVASWLADGNAVYTLEGDKQIQIFFEIEGEVDFERENVADTKVTITEIEKF